MPDASSSSRTEPVSSPPPRECHASAPLSAFTTFQLGGPCRALIHCRTGEALLETVRDLGARGDAFLLTGEGSNLLVSDAGYPGTVVRFASETPSIRRLDETTVWISGATRLDALAAFCVDHGLRGAEFASGIPGTVGGAIVGNAGAFGEQIGDRMVDLELIDRQGRLRTIPRAAVTFAYRASSLQTSGDTVLAARLRVEKGDPEALRARRQEILDLRRAMHPDWRQTPCAGSFFKNIEPTSAAGRRQSAGWFLDQAGARTLRVGGARVFEKHANIVIKGEASCTADDVCRLAARMAEAVYERFGLTLVREVQLVGAFPASPDQAAR